MTSHAFRYGAGSLAVVASLLALLSFGSGSSSAPELLQPQDPVVTPRSVGDVPLPLAESTTVVLQNTPDQLLDSVIAARGRRDIAALARCSSTTAGQPALDQFDAARAERDFFDGEQLWTLLTAAKNGRTLQIDDVKAPVFSAEDRAQKVEALAMVTAPVKGAKAAGLSEVQIGIVRIAGAWYVRVSP